MNVPKLANWPEMVMVPEFTYPKGNWFQRTRVHETGHAVAAYLVGYGVGDIRISKRCRQGYATAGLVRPLVLKNEDDFITYLEREVYVHLAGGVAEAYFSGRPRPIEAMQGDYAALLSLFHQLLPTVPLRDMRRVIKKNLDVTEPLAAKWFSKPEYMKAVAALANALKEKPNMQGREAIEIIRSTGLKPVKEWLRQSRR